MNIFVLSWNQQKNAEYYVDAHVSKMILEHTQILSTVLRQSGVDQGYKACYQKHPCVLWCGESLSNWIWLRRQTFFLHEEFKYRFKNVHKSWFVAEQLPLPNIKERGLTKFALAMPDKYKTRSAISSYRKYYLGDKSHLFRWTGRPQPDWISQ